MALAQANEVADRLAAAGVEKSRCEIVVIKTSGDQITHKPLAQEGGKGLFTKEIEQALLDGDIDLAVHSGKDMPTEQPEGLELACFLPREDPADGFISAKATSIDGLPAGAIVGTASLRRRALVKRMRPDLTVVPFRGLVATRLAKLREGRVDATLLAAAGVNRLGQGEVLTSRLSPQEFLPAPAQGAIVIEIRSADQPTRDLLRPLDDMHSRQTVLAERAFLRGLDGSCQTPIAAHATLIEGELMLRGQILLPDGSQSYEVNLSGGAESAESVGEEAASLIRLQTDPVFWDRLQAQFTELAAELAV